MKRISIIFIALFLLLVSTSYGVAIQQRYMCYMGSSGPCLDSLLAYYDNTINTDGKLQDLSATGAADALPGMSLSSTGSSYITYATPVQLTGSFKRITFYYIPNSFSGYHFAVGSSGVGLGSYESLVRFEITTGYINFKIADDYASDPSTSGLTVDAVNKVVVEINNDTEVSYYINDIAVGTATCTSGTFWFNRLGLTSSLNLDGYIYGVILEDSSGIKYQDSLAVGTGTKTAPVVGPSGTLTNFTVPDDWTDSALYGHTYNEDGYILADGTGDYDSGAILPNIAAYESEGTQYPGPLAQNHEIYGYTGNWGGSTSADIGIAGEYEVDRIVIRFKTPSTLTPSSETTLYGSMEDSDFRKTLGIFWHPAVGLYLVIGDQDIIMLDSVVVGKWYTVDLSFTETTYTAITNGVTVTGVHDMRPLIDFNFPLFLGALGYEAIPEAFFRGIILFLKTYKNGVLVDNFVSESSNTSTQSVIYNAAGGNDATLSGATTPFFTTAFKYTANAGVLGRNGGVLNPSSGDLAVNGDASDTTYTDSSVHALVGFNNYVTHNATNKVTIESGSFRLISDGTNIAISPDITLPASTEISIEVDVLTVTSGSIQIGGGPTVTTDVTTLDTAQHYSFTTTTDGSGLMGIKRTYGVGAVDVTFDNLEISYVSPGIAPYGATANANTFSGAQDAPADTIFLNAPLSTEFAAADTLNEFIDVGGSVIDLDPNDITESDTVRKGSDGMAVTTEAQTGVCLDKTNTYVGD